MFHCLGALEAGAIDAWVYDTMVGVWKIDPLGFHPDQFEVVHKLQEERVYFVFSRGTPAAVVAAFQETHDTVRIGGPFELLGQKVMPWMGDMAALFSRRHPE